MAITTSELQLQKAYQLQKEQRLGHVDVNHAMNAPVQPTIASAVGQIDTLNHRLMSIKDQLSLISDAIGGPRPTSGIAGERPVPGGVVHRLQDGVETAHGHASEIEELIGAITRALG